MKKLVFLLLVSFLVLGACGQKEESNSDDKKSESKDKGAKEKKTKDFKRDEKENKDETSKNQSNNHSQTKENNSSEQISQQEIPQVNLGNITDRNALESVINGNYSEEEKIQAYNSAVANGVIPQGNIMEGPASAAYQSSLRVESGAEKSVYEQSSDDPSESEPEVTSESNPSSPRSLREIKEQTGRGASEFTPEEKAEAQAYADQH